MLDALTQALVEARAAILADPRGELTFAVRRPMLRLLGPVDHSRLHPPGFGRARRARLCIAAARRVLPVWHRHYEATHPDRMIELAEALLFGQVAAEEVREDAYGFGGGLDNNDGTEAYQVAYLAGRASVCAAYVAAIDELIEPDDGVTEEVLLDPEDPDFWDCAYWAAGAEAGGMPWTSGFDRDRYRRFWLWYVDEAVPTACRAAEGPRSAKHDPPALSSASLRLP